MHALSARPLKVHGGRGWSLYADETIKINLISLCSHTDAHPNLNREVRHSLTWHSSKSESALERFEPVAVVCYSGTVGALCSHRSPRGDRRCLKEEFLPLFVLFVLFGQAKRTLKDKYHKETFLLSYFSVTKRMVQGGVATSERRRRDRGG